MLAADESDPAPWLCAVVPAHACFPWTNQPPHSFVGSLKKNKKTKLFHCQTQKFDFKTSQSKKAVVRIPWGAIWWSFSFQNEATGSIKVNLPAGRININIHPQPRRYKALTFWTVITGPWFISKTGYRRRSGNELWSVIADGYQCFPLIWAQRGKKIPPVGGRYLLPLFGASSCWRLKVGASFHSELIGVFGSSAKEKWVSRALVVFLNERCWLSWKSVFGITNTSLTNLRNFVSKCVFFSIGSRPSSLWMFDLDTWQVVRLSRSHRSVTSVQLSPCSCLDVDALMCKARVTKAAGHEAEEIQKWNVGCSRKVDINTDAKFLGILFLLCLYCNFFVLNIAERCVVIPSLWWITLYSTSSVEPAKLQQKQKFKISIDFPSVLLLQMEF